MEDSSRTSGFCTMHICAPYSRSSRAFCAAKAALSSSASRLKGAIRAKAMISSGACHVCKLKNISEPISSHSVSSGYSRRSSASVSEV